MATIVLGARVDTDLKKKFDQQCEDQSVEPADVMRTLFRAFAEGDLIYTTKEESIDVRD